MNRRRIRKYRNQRRNSGMKFLGFIGIMIIAVICGYLTARFVIAPLLGYDTEVLKLDLPSKLTAVFDRDDGESDIADKDTDDEDESMDTEQDQEDEDQGSSNSNNSDDGEEGFALQFGLFSTKAKAQELVDKLEAEGIDSGIKEIDGKYKVISPLVDTKEEAVEKLKNTDSKEVPDVFITAIK